MTKGKKRNLSKRRDRRSERKHEGPARYASSVPKNQEPELSAGEVFRDVMNDLKS